MPLSELLRDHARLHDGGVEDVASEHEEAAIGLQRPLERADDGRVHDLPPAAILAERAAVDGERPFPDETMLHQLVDDRGHATGAVIVLAQVLARGLQVDEEGYLVAELLPVLE